MTFEETRVLIEESEAALVRAHERTALPERPDTRSRGGVARLGLPAPLGRGGGLARAGQRRSACSAERMSARTKSFTAPLRLAGGSAELGEH